jgi:hypothetical protein
MIGVLIGGWKFVKDKSAQESFAANNPPSYRGLLLKPANHVGRGRICDAKGCRKVMKHWRRSWGIPYYFCDEHEAHIDATYKADEDSLFNSESEGEKVRNRLQGSDVGPEDDMLETPSIYRDWPMVQKGYQSLRMMNDNDNFNSEGFGSEWHHFAPCETAGCDGDIEYRDVYYCSSCGQDDTEILIGDRCPECEEVATDTATYAIFYCSDCGEDFSDEYNAEVRTTANKVRTISGKPLQLRKLKKDRDLKPEDAIERLEISAETFNALSPICKRCGLSEAGSHQLDPTGETGICIICTFNQKMGLNAEGRFSAEKYYEEDPERYYNPQFEPYDSFPTKDSAEQLYIKTKDFINTWSEGWDDYRTANQENGGYFTSLNAVKKDANKEAKYYARKGYFPFYQSEDSSGINFTCQKSEGGKRTYNRAFNTYSEPLKDYTERVEIKYELIEKMGAESDENCDLNYHLRCNECRICLDCDPEADAGGAVCRFCTGESIERFNAYVYRGKPMEDLNYSQRAVATKKMIDAADLEGTILQLENAIRMGLISEDELMKELQNKFGSM